MFRGHAPVLAALFIVATATATPLPPDVPPDLTGTSWGGMGTISGTLIAGLVLGIADVACKYYVPQIGGFVIYAITVAVMLWRPHGLLGRRA